MSTYTKILYHIVFGTKGHYGTLDEGRMDELHSYIAGLLKNKNCFVYKIGGATDHIHILTGLHPSVSLAGTVKDIKLASSKWIKQGKVFPGFDGWQKGYGAFTCSWADVEKVERYIGRQKEHHRRKTFREEYEDMLKRAGIEYDSDWLV